jgi:hypothetical protein
MTIGCCADHLIDEGKLINTAVGGVTTSREHTLSINGQGEPWSIDYQRVRDAINNAIDKLNVINIPHVPDGFYVPTSVDANLPGDTWQQGSGSWMYFEGLGTDMEIEAPLLTASEEEYTVSVNATTGRVDGSVSKTAYYTAGSDSIPCTPVDVGETVCNFAEALNGILFNN